MRRTVIAAKLATGLAAIGQPASASEHQPPQAEGRQDAQALASKAIEYLQRGEDLTDKASKMAAYQEGLDCARRAVAIDETNADAHFAIFGNEGRILLLEGVTPNPVSLLKVNRELERALQLNPNHADALAAKGGLYRQLPWVLGGSLSLAERCLTKAIEIDPEAVGARIELAATYRDMGYPERSVPLLEKAVSIAERQGKRRQLSEARSLMHELQAP